MVLTHSLTYLLTYSLTYSLTHLLTHSPTYSPTHSPTSLLTHLLRNVSDFITCATTQTKMENDLLMKASKYLFCDTDAFATSIWCWRYLGEWSKEVPPTHSLI